MLLKEGSGVRSGMASRDAWQVQRTGQGAIHSLFTVGLLSPVGRKPVSARVRPARPLIGRNKL